MSVETENDRTLTEAYRYVAKARKLLMEVVESHYENEREYRPEFVDQLAEAANTDLRGILDLLKGHRP